MNSDLHSGALFFPSVSSSAKTLLSPLDHVRILNAFHSQQYLVSAYDWFHSTSQTEFVDALRVGVETGALIALDSGLYERFWNRDHNWEHEHYLRALKEVPHHIAFSFDPIESDRSPSEYAKSVAQLVKASEEETDATIVPIVHSLVPASLPEVCRIVTNATGCEWIAVPERELGDNVEEAVPIIRRIVEAIEETDTSPLLHILGAGNPKTILMYSRAGARSFDGLDWCQTVADHSTATLHHSRQLPFFSDQTDIASRKDLSYPVRLLGHNLSFFEKLMGCVNEAIATGAPVPIDWNADIEEVGSS